MFQKWSGHPDHFCLTISRKICRIQVPIGKGEFFSMKQNSLAIINMLLQQQQKGGSNYGQR